ncbi:uncharacterized protein METZ01_LOCUS135063 [marine metagenome]|uniref:Uncharacterized protein n=1 Tax=marine metagenome TaxID=408172 RepID=A0A381YZ36_9ZZZZ
MPMVMPFTFTDQVAIDDAGLVHEGTSADFQVELAFGHGRQPSGTSWSTIWWHLRSGPATTRTKPSYRGGIPGTKCPSFPRHRRR